MVNKVILIGRMGNDPEIKFTQAGTAICNFSLATSGYAGKDKEKKTDWHKCLCFNKTAELITEYCTKGSQLFVEGRIQYGSYENKDGQKVYTTEIVVNEVKFLGSKKDKQAEGSDDSF